MADNTLDSNNTTSSDKDLIQKKSFDQKLVHSLNAKKIPSLKQFKYLPEVLDQKQKKVIRLSLLTIVVSLFFLAGSYYFINYKPAPAPGGEYTEGLIGAPQYINPLLSQTNDVDSDITRLVFSGLLKYNQDLHLVPDLAESWTTSDDKKEYTFVIKEHVFWHDGQPLTIDDVIFTFQSIKDPDFKSPLLISFRGVNIQKIDERTVKFILPEPYQAFLEIMTVGILPEHIWGEIPPINANLTEYNIKPIGTGAWKFKSLFKDKLGNIKSYVLVPNENFYGPKPYIQQLTFKFYPDFQTAVGALKNNSVEGISFLPKDLRSELAAEKNLRFNSYYLPQYTAMFFNQKHNELLKDKNIRKALALGIDKSKILTEALQLEGEIIDGPILPVSVEISDEERLNFNPTQANLILDEAGWKKLTHEEYQNWLTEQAQAAEDEAENVEATAIEATDEMSESEAATSTAPIVAEPITPAPPETNQKFFRLKDDTILEITLTTVQQPENTKEAELIAQMWRDIGVKVNLQIVESGRISREVIKPRAYDILLFGIIVGSNPDPYPFWHSSQAADPGLNLSLLANREVDSLLEKVRVETDPEELQASYQRFNNILINEIPAIFLHNPTYSYIVDQKIKGSNIDRITVPSDRFNDIENWYIKTKRQYQANL